MSYLPLRRLAALTATTMLALVAVGMSATAAPVGNGVLVGRITGPDGSALPGAAVQFDSGDKGATVLADDDGSYRLSTTPGTYPVSVADPCGVYDTVTTAPTTLTAGQETRLDVQLTAPGQNPPTAPCNRIYPVMTGAPKVNTTLSVTSGVWSQPGTIVTYQWYEAPIGGAGAPIAGATTSRFLLSPSSAGRNVWVDVTASLSGHATTVDIHPGSVILPGDLPVTHPTLAGVPAVKALLSAHAGPTIPGTRATFQWRRGNVPIVGATGSTHRVTSADRGKAISVAVTYQAAGYNPVTRVLKASFAVRRLAHESVKVKAGHHRATFTVRVSPKSSKHHRGTITVRDDSGHKVKGATIRSGSITFTATHLHHGKRRYTVTYRGTTYAAEKTVTIKVR